jgi:hypothetical protein
LQADEILGHRQFGDMESLSRWPGMECAKLSILKIVMELGGPGLLHYRRTRGPVSQALSPPDCILLRALSDLDLGSSSGCRVEVNTHWGSALGGKSFDSSISTTDDRLVGVSKLVFLSLRILDR